MKHPFNKIARFQHLGGQDDYLPLSIDDALQSKSVGMLDRLLLPQWSNHFHLHFSTPTIGAIDGYGFQTKLFVKHMHLFMVEHD